MPRGTEAIFCITKQGEKMRRSITAAITLAVSVILLSLVSSDSTTHAQLRGKLFHWDTGVVALGPNQVLRIMGDWNGDGDTTVGYREIKYGQGDCNGAVCKLVIIGTTTSGPHNVPAGEGISFSLVASTYGRGIITSNRRDVQVTASIINTLTGETTSHIIMANTEGDFH
jgi:hypothetical protein